MIYGIEEGKKMLFSTEEEGSSPKPSPRAKNASNFQALSASSGFQQGQKSLRWEKWCKFWGINGHYIEFYDEWINNQVNFFGQKT